jgi:hypothetical protein
VGLISVVPVDGSVEEDPEALGGGDETQLGDYNEEEEDAAVQPVAPPPFDSSAAASTAATASAASGSRRVLLKDVHQWADIPHEDGAILHVMLNIINGHGSRVYTRPGIHARAAKGDKMDGSVNVAFFCQKLATVNANLQHNGQVFTFGLQNGAAARTVLNKVKTMARQEMTAQMLAQDTGGGAELADNPNEWPDAKEPRHIPLTAPSGPMLDVTTTQMVSSLWPAMPWPMSGMPTLRQRRPMRTALKRRPKRKRRSERRNQWHPLVVTRTAVSRPAKPPGMIV